MKPFVERLTLIQTNNLLKEMRINTTENVNTIEVAIYGGKIYARHGKIKGKEIQSVYSDFEIEKIYNSAPSDYDQKRYQNYMKSVFEKEYEQSLKAFLSNKEDNDENDL